MIVAARERNEDGFRPEDGLAILDFEAVLGEVALS